MGRDIIGQKLVQGHVKEKIDPLVNGLQLLSEIVKTEP